MPADAGRQLGGVHEARRRRRRAPGGVRQPYQQGQDHPVRHQGRAAVGDEGHCQTRERDEARDSPDDDEDLYRDREGQSDGEQLAEAVAQAHRGAQSALDEQQVEHENGEGSRQSQLLADGGDDEVGVREGDEVRVARAPARAEHTPRGHAEQAHHQLPRAALCVVDRRVHGVQPRRDALLHVVQVGGGEPGRRHEQEGAEDQPARSIGGDVERDDEQAEQQDRRAQVLLHDQDQDADAPHDHEGAEVACAR